MISQFLRLFALSAGVLTTLAANTAPEQIHIAFAGKDAGGAPTGMRIAWFTKDLPSSASTVKYGTLSGLLTSRTVSTTAAKEYYKGHGYHHAVEVTSLTPDTKYYYAVGCDASGWSSEWSFQTAPSSEVADATQITMSVFGDWGYEDSAKRPMEIAVAGLVENWTAALTRNQLESLRGKMQMIWHLGDIGYMDDSYAHDLLGFSYESTYNGYMNWIQNLSATVPYMVSPGNHESECHSPNCLIDVPRSWALRNFTAFNSRWHMPSTESGGHPGSAMWYSWNYGPIHFVSINTETDWDGAEEKKTGDSHDPLLTAGHFGADGEYLNWLEADLKAAAQARDAATNGGSGPRFIVAGGHRPYGDIKGKHTDLFQKYGVDLYVAGHGHSYRRGAAVNGTTYIMVGGAGCDEMAWKPTAVGCDPKAHDAARQGSSCQPDYAVPEGSSQFATDQIAIGLLHGNATHILWELLDSATGKVLDEITIPARKTRSLLV